MGSNSGEQFRETNLGGNSGKQSGKNLGSNSGSLCTSERISGEANFGFVTKTGHKRREAIWEAICLPGTRLCCATEPPFVTMTAVESVAHQFTDGDAILAKAGIVDNPDGEVRYMLCMFLQESCFTMDDNRRVGYTLDVRFVKLTEFSLSIPRKTMADMIDIQYPKCIFGID